MLEVLPPSEAGIDVITFFVFLISFIEAGIPTVSVKINQQRCALLEVEALPASVNVF
jgi:hypothetical protein